MLLHVRGDEIEEDLPPNRPTSGRIDGTWQRQGNASLYGLVVIV